YRSQRWGPEGLRASAGSPRFGHHRSEGRWVCLLRSRAGGTGLGREDGHVWSRQAREGVQFSAPGPAQCRARTLAWLLGTARALTPEEGASSSYRTTIPPGVWMLPALPDLHRRP